MNHRIEQGRGLAVAGSLILISSAAGSSLLGLFTLLALTRGQSLGDIVFAGSLPWLASICYLAAVVGTALVIVALLVYGYRARWFWGCLMATAILWIMAPPLLMVIGLIALVVLLRLRDRFPHHPSTATSPAP